MQHQRIWRVGRVFAMAVMLLGITAACAQANASTKTNQADQHSPHAGMLRYPDISKTHITFVYANDLWIVPRGGGMASTLAGPAGLERFPRFSPDGQTIAFVGNYDGNSDLYTIPITGGQATRVTYHPARETLCDWTGDDRLVFFFSGLAGLRRQSQLFTVSTDGAMPEKLPVPYGANGSISADGTWLAYTPHTRDHRTWKRYRGGMATDIWLFNLKDHTSRKITDWEGTDSQPMWHGNVVYYLSDAGPEHRLNIWSYDLESEQRKQVTQLSDFDVKWPAMGPGVSGEGEIVFQKGRELVVLNLKSGDMQAVQIQIPGDRPTIRPKQVDAGERISAWEISSTGKRAALEARGDIWTIPAKHGAPRNLTATDDVAERDPSWSPDGQWLAYFSDESGEYELYITQSDGKGETTQLTTDGKLFRYAPTWSPDSKLIAFGDKSGAMYLHTIETKETKLFDTDQWSGLSRMNWSLDSRWIAYTKGCDNRLSAVWLYDVAEGAAHQVTAGMFNDSWPTFDRKGEFLYFASSRNFTSPTYEDVGTTFVYADTEVLLAVPLRDDIASPFAAKSDEEKWGDDKDEDGDDEDDDDSDEKGKDKDNGKSDGDSEDDDSDKDGDSEDDDEGDDDSDDDESDDDDSNDDDDKKKDDKDDVEPVKIDLVGFERRAITLPVKRGSFAYLNVNDEGQLLYRRGGRRGSEEKQSIKIFDMHDDKSDKKEEKTVLAEVGAFVMSADGKKIAVLKKGKTLFIVDAAADQEMDKPLSLGGMNVSVDPRAEWRQVFLDAWRLQRDFFYDPNMHGVDWEKIKEQYSAMLADCSSRSDVSFVIGEMMSELNVGHAYVRGAPDGEDPPKVSVGMLGADFALKDGAYQITRIYEGAAWDHDARGPLSEPGVDVEEGDYLLAVDGVPIDTTRAVWASFQGLAGRATLLTVSETPQIDDDSREVLVTPMGNESKLRFRAWIEHNRKYVDRSTAGAVGYIYVPDTGRNGQNELIRQFYGQVEKSALIVDERWNGGGQIPTRFIELLNRPRVNYWAVRHGNDWTWPPDSHVGPKCMLINGLAGSGGDCFPFYFRQAGLGKLIGMRTWGGLVGYSGNPRLIDGGAITSPSFAFYEMDGTWGIEGHGVDPDIEVIDDPALMVDGRDPQLDVAVELMLTEIKRNPSRRPERPAYPNRSGMGIPVEDR